MVRLIEAVRALLTVLIDDALLRERGVWCRYFQDILDMEKVSGCLHQDSVSSIFLNVNID